MAIKVASIAKEGKSAGFFGFIKFDIFLIFAHIFCNTIVFCASIIETGDIRNRAL